jgi:hypothetical protein
MKNTDEFAVFRRLVQEPGQTRDALRALVEQSKHDGQFECAEIAIKELNRRFPGWDSRK